MHEVWQGTGMSGEHTDRSGPRVYHVGDGDYTQKIEDKDGRITHLSQQWKKENETHLKEDNWNNIRSRKQSEEWALITSSTTCYWLDVQIPSTIPIIII